MDKNRILKITVQLSTALIITLMAINLPVKAQERVKPSRVYQAGESITAPVYGLTLILPENWRGYLTRETSIFTLNCDSVNDVNIRVFPSEESLASIKARWSQGVELSPGLKAMPIGEVEKTHNGLKTEFEFNGNPGVKGFSRVECGSYGHCYTAFITAPTTIYKDYINALEKLAEGTSFKEPWLEDFYGDHDWNEALSAKYIFNYDIGEGSRKTNQLWLCENGTFETKIIRKKALKGIAGPYHGKQKGTYRIEGVGPTGVLILEFKDLAPLRLDLLFKEEHIFINEQRFLASAHDKCQ